MAIPDDVRLLKQQASALFNGRDLDAAIAAHEKLLAWQPDLADSWYNLGLLHYRARDHHRAIADLRHALSLGIAQPEEVHLQLGVILSDGLGDSDGAEAELGTALALNADYVPAWLNLGNLHEDFGVHAEAERAYRRALAIDPTNTLALARLAGIKTRALPDDPLIAELREASARPGISLLERADLGFALGRLLDSAAVYDDAFAAYAAANQASAALARAEGHRYDRAAQETLIDRIISAFGAADPSPTMEDDEAPLFICGMFRSGSTLAEQILSSHSRLISGGELGTLPSLIRSSLPAFPDGVADADVALLRRRYLVETADRSRTGAQLIDKQLTNFLYVGVIKRMWPRAKIVFTRRAALDNCLSVYFLHADPSISYGTDLIDIAHHYRQHDRLMRHWQGLYGNDILQLDYDRLVESPESAMRGLIDFCGLSWEEGVLSFHDRKQAVRTASNWQVREPIYGRSSGRWRRYERHLGGLRQALGLP